MPLVSNTHEQVVMSSCKSRSGSRAGAALSATAALPRARWCVLPWSPPCSPLCSEEPGSLWLESPSVGPLPPPPAGRRRGWVHPHSQGTSRCLRGGEWEMGLRNFYFIKFKQNDGGRCWPAQHLTSVSALETGRHMNHGSSQRAL